MRKIKSLGLRQPKVSKISIFYNFLQFSWFLAILGVVPNVKLFKIWIPTLPITQFMRGWFMYFKLSFLVVIISNLDSWKKSPTFFFSGRKKFSDFWKVQMMIFQHKKNFSIVIPSSGVKIDFKIFLQKNHVKFFCDHTIMRSKDYFLQSNPQSKWWSKLFLNLCFQVA